MKRDKQSGILKNTEVYYVNCGPLADGSLFERIYDQMPDERKARIDSYRFNKDKRLSLGAGYLAKIYNPDGMFHQNISHSGDIAVLAISDQPVGVDIERIKMKEVDSEENRRRIKLAERFFHEEEFEYLKKLKNPDSAFTRIWTMKESYVKMLGTGFATDPKTFSVFDQELLENIHGISYTFTSDDSISGYIISVCAAQDSFEVLKKHEIC